jgi:hypothetical protein
MSDASADGTTNPQLAETFIAFRSSPYDAPLVLCS